MLSSTLNISLNFRLRLNMWFPCRLNMGFPSRSCSVAMDHLRLNGALLGHINTSRSAVTIALAWLVLQGQRLVLGNHTFAR